ncbi:hypothetical protein scyTo_0023792, partial [Scyliorhinus torazame]|nr:hypothetical protein [Scyliorhinus torazame]
SDRHPLMPNDASDAIYSHLDNSGKSMYISPFSREFMFDSAGFSYTVI